jgi:hypothetical protein
MQCWFTTYNFGFRPLKTFGSLLTYLSNRCVALLGFTSVSFNDEYIVAGTGSYDETFELSTIFVEKTISVRCCFKFSKESG